MYYILSGKKVIKEKDVLKWAKWFENAKERRVAHTRIKGVSISTVFLGLDHSFDDNSLPLLFETMVFSGKLGEEQERYATWEQAEKGHKEMVERVKNTITR